MKRGLKGTLEVPNEVINLLIYDCVSERCLVMQPVEETYKDICWVPSYELKSEKLRELQLLAAIESAGFSPLATWQIDEEYRYYYNYIDDNPGSLVKTTLILVEADKHADLAIDVVVHGKGGFGFNGKYMRRLLSPDETLDLLVNSKFKHRLKSQWNNGPDWIKTGKLQAALRALKNGTNE